MANRYYQAKALWRSNQKTQALELLKKDFEEHFQKPVFVYTPSLFGKVSDAPFDMKVWSMLTTKADINGPDTVQIPFAQVWTYLWSLDPSQIWISLLREYDFAKNVSASTDVTPVSTEVDFSQLTDVLAQSAKKGILSSDFEDEPNGGRAVLTLKTIQQLDASKWGSLKPMLLDKLSEAYTQTPANAWEQLAESEPKEVVIRFLHHLFVNGAASINDVQGRWNVISANFEDYANAVIASLEKILKSNVAESELLEIVQIDGGFNSVSNGATWLQTLLATLKDEDSFENLAA